MKDKNHRAAMVAMEGMRVKRFHTQSLIERQTVGQHTANMLALAFTLHPDPSYELIRAITFHDVAERFTGDTPHPVKNGTPELRQLLNKIENEAARHFEFDESLSESDSRWMHALDMLECMLAGEHELYMGNQYAHRISVWMRGYLLTAPQIPKEIFEFVDAYEHRRSPELAQKIPHDEPWDDGVTAP